MIKLIDLLKEIKINRPFNIEELKWSDWEKLINSDYGTNNTGFVGYLFDKFGYKQEGLWKFIKNLPIDEKINFYFELKNNIKI